MLRLRLGKLLRGAVPRARTASARHQYATTGAIARHRAVVKPRKALRSLLPRRLFGKKKKVGKQAATLGGSRLARDLPPPPPRQPIAMEEEILVYEDANRSQTLLQTGTAGSMIVFWSSFTGYSYLQPGLEDFTAMAGAATLFSMGLLGMMNAMKERYVARLVLEQGGRSVRMGYNDLFGQMQWMGPYHLSEVTMPVTVNTMDTKRRYLQFKIEGKRSYFLIDRKNGTIHDKDAMKHIYQRKFKF